MDILSPTVKALDGLSRAQLDRIATLSGVPVHTIIKIQRGDTKNPGVLAIQKLFPVVCALAQSERM